MTTIKSGNNNIWPKAFYDNGGGSFGFTPANKLQTGVVGANLQLGTTGPILSGSTGQIISGSGASQIIIGSGGITIGGSPISTSGVALKGLYTWPDPSPGVGIDHGQTLGPFADIIPHGLAFTPALACFVLDDLPSLYTPGGGIALTGWRPWNNGFLDTAQNDFNLSTGYSDAYVYSLDSFPGGPYIHTGKVAYYLQANIDDTNLYISETIYGDYTSSSFPIDGMPTPARTFTFLLYNTSID